ncbi:hypothetical protein PI125_g11580 [Phytophthora idaei]|nr:hypothetical protein PI125_g11580 [Phytophthora idaei]
MQLANLVSLAPRALILLSSPKRLEELQLQKFPSSSVNPV